MKCCEIYKGLSIWNQRSWDVEGSKGVVLQKLNRLR